MTRARRTTLPARDYAELDAAIAFFVQNHRGCRAAAIAKGCARLLAPHAEATGRDPMRLLESRMNVMRKAKLITIERGGYWYWNAQPTITEATSV